MYRRKFLIFGIIIVIFAFLTACDKTEKFTVTFKIEGDQDIVLSTVELENIPEVPIRQGYLGEWNIKDFDNIKSDTIVTAVYTPIQYKINYHLNGGAYSGVLVENYTIESPEIMLPVLDKQGWIFIGWFDNPDYAGEPVSFIPKSNFGNKNYYALFAENQIFYDVYLQSNSPVEVTITGAGKYSAGEQVLIYTQCLETGYTFVGWFEGEQLKSYNPSYTFSMPEHNVNYFARWEKEKYQLTLINDNVKMGNVSGEGLYTWGDTVKLIAAPNEGYQFAGWYDENNKIISEDIIFDYEMPINEVTITAKWKANDFQLILFNEDELAGSIQGSGEYAEGESVTLFAFAYDGYIFSGWYLTGDGEDRFLDSNPSYEYIMPSGAIEITAKWQKKVFTLTLIGDGIEGSVTGGGEYEYNSLVTITATANEGYRFVYWQGDIPLHNSTDSFIITKETVITVIWEAYIYFVEIYYDIIGAGTYLGEGSYTTGETVTLVAQPNEGYIFKGWYEEGVLLSNEIEYIFSMPAKDLNLKISWEKTTYLLEIDNFESQKGSVTGAGKYPWGERVEIYATPNDGYYFGGWYQNGQLVSQDVSYIIEQMPMQDLRYSVSWIEGTEGLTYELLSDGTYAVTGGGNSLNIIIPAIYNNLPVTVIASDAFRNTSITSLSFAQESTITKIESGAFWGSSLTQISFPENLEVIEENAFGDISGITILTLPDCDIDINAFSGCENLKEVYNLRSYINLSAANNKLEKIEIHFQHLPANAFLGFTELNKVITVNEIISIGDYSFYGCSNLTQMPQSSILESIGNYAFSESGIINVNVPQSVQNIGEGAFAYCVSLKQASINAELESLSSNLFYDCSSLQSVDIKNSILYIEDSAFYGCQSITQINIPENLLLIGNSAFRGSGIIEIILPNSIEVIGEEAFAYCLGITKIKIPAEVSSIGGFVFAGCDYLTHIEMPVKQDVPLDYYFGYYDYSFAITDFIVNGGEYICGDFFNKAFNLENIFIPATVISVTEDAINSLVMPNLKNVVVDEDNAYYKTVDGVLYDKSLKTLIAYPSQKDGEEYDMLQITEVLKSYAFYHSKLTNINLSDNLKMIEDYAFSSCTNLHIVSIPQSVNYIGEGILYHASVLTEVTLPFIGANPEGSIDTTFGYLFGGKQYIPQTIRKVIITGGNTIGNNSFRDLMHISEITIPNSITHIGDYAFSGLSNITELSLPENLISIGERVFFGSNIISDLIIPKNIRSMHEEALYGMRLKSLTLPYIGEYNGGYITAGLASCAKLTIKGGNNSIIVGIDDEEYLQEIILPENLSIIKSRSFEGFSNIKVLNIPAYVQTIESGSFYGLSGLEEISLPFLGENGKSSGSFTAFNEYFRGFISEIPQLPQNLSKVIVRGGYYIGADAFNAYNVNFDGIRELSLPIGAILEPGCLSGIPNLNYLSVPEGHKLPELFNGISIGHINTLEIYGGEISSLFVDYSQLIIGPYVNNIDVRALSDKVENISANANPLYSSHEGVLYNNDYTELVKYPGGKTDSLEFIINKNIVTLGDYCFCRTNISKVIFEDDSNLLQIGDFAFSEQIQLKNITLPENLKTIGVYAFHKTGLTEISIPSMVETIGNYAFLETNVANVDFEQNSSLLEIGRGAFSEIENLTSIELPLSLLTIQDSVFYNSGLESINLDQLTALEYIGEYSFYNTQLTQIIIPRTVTVIEQFAFSGTLINEIIFSPGSCLSHIGMKAFSEIGILEQITLPDSVQSVGEGIFEGVKGTRSITVPDLWGMPLGYLFNITNALLPENLTNVEITRAEVLVYGAFENTYYVTEVNLPETLIEIRSNAFSNSALTKLTLPESLKTIGSYAFQNMMITEFIIPEGVASIGAYAFKNTLLENLVIPAGVSSIGSGAFENMPKLHTLTVPFIGTNSEYTLSSMLGNLGGIQATRNLKTVNLNNDNRPNGIPAVEFGAFDGIKIEDINIIFESQHYCSVNGVLFSADMEKLLRYPEGKTQSEYILPEQVKIIDYKAFASTQLSSVILGEKVEVIESSAFADSLVKNVNFAEATGLYEIGSLAFLNTRITKFIMPERFQILGSSAFRNSQLEFVELKSGVKLEDGAFSATNLTHIFLPTGIVVGERAFGSNSEFTIYAQDSVKPIAWSNLWNDYGAQVYWGVSNYIITEDYRYIVLDNKATIIEYLGSNSHITLPRELDGVEVNRIGRRAFSNTGDYIYISLGDFVEYMERYAFYGNYYIFTENQERPFGWHTEWNYFSSVFWQSDGVHIFGDYIYTVVNGNAVIMGYQGSENNLIIPSQIDFMDVVGIFDFAFKDNKSIESIYLPQTIESIGRESFRGATYLKNVFFESGSSLVNIDNLAFLDCLSLETIDLSNTIFLKKIGIKAFENCASLVSMTLPASIVQIGNEAFRGCISLIDFVFNLDSTITSIDDNVFRDCDSLEIINLPNTITSISNSAFENCFSIQNISLPFELQSLGHSVFKNCISLTSVHIPIGVEALPESTFSGCENLSLVTFAPGSSLSEIGMYTFKDCSSLSALILPENLKSVQNYAFEDCVNLLDIDFENGKGNALFARFALQGCIYLERITIPQTTDRYLYNFANVFGDTVPKNNLEVLVTDQTISAGYFQDCLFIGTIILSEELQEISSDAFKNATGIRELYIPSKVERIYWNAFEGCTSLETVIFAENSMLSELYDSAFMNCVSLKNINLPDSITMIGQSVFEGCGNLSFQIDEQGLKYLGNWVFGVVTKEIVQANLKPGIIGIYHEVFMDCENLTEVYANDELRFIGENTFKNAINLTIVSLPNSVNTIMQSAFYNCSNLKSFKIPLGVTELPAYLFSHSGIETIFIHQYITNIASTTFNLCRSLYNMDVHLENVNYTSIDGIVYNKQVTEMKFLPLAKNGKYISPETLSIIKYGQFKDSMLNSITLTKVTSIENLAFSNASNLFEIIILCETPPVLLNYAFDNMFLNTKFYVPQGFGAVYKSSPIWSEYADRIFEINN